MKSFTAEKIFFFTLLLLVAVFTLFIFKPFLVVITLGAALSVVLYPLFLWLKNHTIGHKGWFASLLSILIFIAILCIPLLFIGTLVFSESQSLYHSIVSGTTQISLQHVGESINHYMPAGLSFDFQQKAIELLSNISNNLTAIFSATFSTLVSFLLVILTIFFFLKDGQNWREMVILVSPLTKADDEKILKKLVRSIHGIFKGTLLIALAQGLSTGIGLALFGVPNPAIWGTLAAVASLIPMIGTALVLLPSVLFLFFFGHTGAALGLTIWSFAIVGTINSILAPFIMSERLEMPPLLVLFSILGGIALVGPVGVLIGPLTISLFYALLSIYQENYSGRV